MRFIVFIILIILGGFTYMKLNPIETVEPIIIESSTQEASEKPLSTHIKISHKPQPIYSQKTYRCDGRVYCSQMRSCTEAKFFINNCPGTKMDGDDDGVPCERQWCR